MFKLYLLALVFILTSISCFAQLQPNIIHVMVSANVAVPSSQLKSAVDNSTGGIGVGAGANILVNPYGQRKQSPVFLGVDFNYLTFGRDKQDETSTTPAYKTSFNFYNINALARVFLNQREEGFIPFIDGALGARIFNTTTKIDKNALHIILNDDQPEVINSSNDTGLGYTVGVGFFNRKYRTNNDGENSGNASFSLRVMYVWGDESRYVKRGSVTVDNGIVSFETGYTQTNMVLVQLALYIF